jgi:hypothetical protein
MASAGHERRQRIGECRGAAWIGRGFDCVNVEVDRAEVLRLPRQHRFERTEHIHRERPRVALGVPVVPGRGVHQRLSKEGGGVEVVRKSSRDLTHRFGVFGVERRTLGGWVGGVTMGQRLDVGALLLTGAASPGAGLFNRAVCLRGGRGGDRRVDVRAEGERDSPVAHGTVGVERCRLAERTDRLGMIEGVGQDESLVEILLGLSR